MDEVVREALPLVKSFTRFYGCSMFSMLLKRVAKKSPLFCAKKRAEPRVSAWSAPA